MKTKHTQARTDTRTYTERFADKAQQHRDNVIIEAVDLYKDIENEFLLRLREDEQPPEHLPTVCAVLTAAVKITHLIERLNNGVHVNHWL